MNVLILTNESYIQFIMGQIPSRNKDDVFLIKAFGEYDWSEDYDIGISFMYTYKVPAKEVKSHPWFNFHPAPLPEYKGRNLCFHAIMNGEKEFGATLHYMDENYDTGDIIEVARFQIPEWWTAEQLSNATIEMSKQLFKVYFPIILENTVFPRQKNRGGTYYKKSEIIEKVVLKPDEPFCQFVRAVTYKDFYPKIEIGGVTYKIVRDENV